MSNFETKVMEAFKAFVNDEANIALDFRTYVFLENQYGNTPIYRYDDAVKIIDCMFSFLTKYRVDFSGRYNRSMTIESLRTKYLKSYLECTLPIEIDEPIFNAINKSEVPKFEITQAFISVDDDNPCLCVNLDEDTQSFICDRLGIDIAMSGAGTDGFINIQYPIEAESERYIAGGNYVDNITGYYDDELVGALVDNIITKAEGIISRRDWELESAIGTSNVTEHENMVLHGYYQGQRLCLLENNESKEAYVTFLCNTHEQVQSFTTPFKEFANLEEAKDYIRSHIDNYQTLQDFGISHDIYQDLMKLQDNGF